MLKVVTAKEMQQIDRVTIEKYGVAGTILMERAGLAVVLKIKELFAQNTPKSFATGQAEHRAQSTDKRQENRQLTTDNRPLPKVIVLAGGGNNGGDGFVVARILHNEGRDVKVFLSAKPEDLKGDAKINYNAAVKFGVKIYPINKFFTSHFSLLTSHFVVVDALLGTGLSKNVRAPLSEVIDKVNDMACPVVSIDIPSGISSDTGEVMGCAVRADVTVTFGLPKRGHLLYPGA